ncbi:MAG TPA: LytR C-terminal domain-containing protein [Mycobacteriales bacterium]|nr:LytR C-terminal domain-containing protein [Mycobacteriales bacterium]
MSDGPSGRPGQPGRPHRFYFDDLADEIADEIADEVPAEQPPVDQPVAQVEPTPPPARRNPRDDGDDDLVDTGPIEVIRDPIAGSAAAQQLYFDDLAPLQHAAYGGRPDNGPFEGEPPADEPSDGETVYAAVSDGPPIDGDGDELQPRGALALAAARKPRPVGAVIAVLAVLALIGVLAAVGGRGHTDHPKQDAAAVRNAPGKTDPTVPATTAPSSSPSAPGTSDTSPRASAPTHRKVAAPGRAPAGVALTVLNNTTTKGLAKSAAQVFSTRGWQVGTVGNYAGQISVTTVYYNAKDDAQRKAAQTLAAQFPGVTQVQPRFADLPGAGLTVVLAPDWHA